VNDHTTPLLCGTSAGYLRHIRAGTPACDECKAAHTLYMRLWRARGGMVSTRQYAEARARALARLARNHPAEYRQLYREERDP
jgi:hypothetical protein